MTVRKNTASGALLARALPAAALLALIPAGAIAHPGHAHTSGLAHGFLHPFTGFDHLLAMLAVGLWAGQRGGRFLRTLPAVCLAGMGVGGGLGMSGLLLPGGGLLLSVSLLAIGVAVTMAREGSLLSAATLIGGVGLIHGHAHGVELAVGASALGYSAGFLAATTILMGAGIAMTQYKRDSGRRAARFAGAAIALVGALFIAGVA